MRSLAAAVAMFVVGAACDRTPRVPELRQFTEDLTFRISSDPMPPRAREPILYKVVVRDKESGAPIENG